jgi:lariat debranching enzyme
MNITTASVSNKVNIIYVGCLHGAFDQMYNDIKKHEKSNNVKIDIVLCCGDFECLRYNDDLNYMSVPDKYIHMGDFNKYFLGKLDVPYLTVFIGGNHEASNVLDENFYGGWISKNVFYLGRSGVIIYKGLRIGGLSGIFNKHTYFKGYFETDIKLNIKSIFHLREFDVVKMSQIITPIDIILSHDWPRDSVSKKDFKQVLNVNKVWKTEREVGTVGKPAYNFLI